MYWAPLPLPLSGTVRLGEVLVHIPAAAVEGQTYSAHFTGGSGSLDSRLVSLAFGTDTTITVTERSYLVGDVHPFTGDDAGQFGKDDIGNLDLIQALRAVTSVPGYRPADCSDRFDSLDAHPSDTSSARGGDGTLTNFDLLLTLRRVVSVDGSRPRRTVKGMSCAARAKAPQAGDPPAGSLEFGSPEALGIPVYLRAHGDLDLAGFSFSAGGSSGFQAAIAEPALLDTGVPGVVSVAWLDGLTAAAGSRILLGYLQPTETPLTIHGLQADSRNGGSVVIRLPNKE
jgi:hypothetical protein